MYVRLMTAYMTLKLSQSKDGEAERLPPQSGHQVMPDVSVPLGGILPEGHTWCVYVCVRVSACVFVCMCVEKGGVRENILIEFSVFLVYFVHTNSELTPPFMCSMLLLNTDLGGSDIWNLTCFCCLQNCSSW